jgi:SAM-dependent MidA family methyltransferase
MAADILNFSTEKDPKVTRTGMNIANELLDALGELAVAQERGGSREHLATLGRSVDAAVRRLSDISDVDSAA